MSAKIISFVQKHNTKFIILFFAVIFAVGCVITPHYGMPIDDAGEDYILVSNAKHIFKTLNPGGYQKAYDRNPGYFDWIDDLPDFIERDHGQSTHYPIGFLAMIAGSYNGQENSPSWARNFVQHKFLYRHYYNFCLCFIALIYFYFIVKFLTTKKIFGLLAVVFVLISPRIFADMFYNSKDMMAFACMAPVIYHGIMFIYKRGFGQVVCFALACAFAVNMRLPCVILPLALFCAAVVCFAFGSRKAGKLNWAALALFPFFSAVFYYIITPAAWSDFPGHIKFVYECSANFNRWDGRVLYNGRYYQPFYDTFPDLPWHYLPKMILMTTPVVITLLFVLGFFFTFRRMSGQKFRDYLSGRDFLAAPVLGFTIVTIAAPIIFGSNIYNGWRQMYFCYAGIVVIAAYSASVMLENFDFNCKAIFTRKKPSVARVLKFLVAGAIALQICSTAGWQVAKHPYQFMYYNFLAGSNPQDRYEVDYWQTGNYYLVMQAMKDIEPEERLRIGSLDGHLSSWGCRENYALWPESIASRVDLVDNLDEADYIMINPLYYNAVNNPDAPVKFSQVYEKLSEGRKCYTVFIGGGPALALIAADQPFPDF